eukprot:4988672-Pleurochrysis_carterae.AAC.1
MPGSPTATARYATYRTDADILGTRHGLSPAGKLSARPSARTLSPDGTEAVATPHRSIPIAADKPSDAPVDVKWPARTACTDLHIASNPRALVATCTARHSDRHARNLRNQGRHIGFVVDSGCTYHIHPHVNDL